MTNHFLDLADIPAATLREILDHAHALKKEKFSPPQILDGLSLAMMFDKNPPAHAFRSKSQ